MRGLATLGKEMKGAKPSGEPGVKVFPDGREVCNQFTTTGRKAYKRRIALMVERKNNMCCLHGICPTCPGWLAEDEATFEHEGGRGMNGGKRDDRIALPDGTWINGAAHLACNQWKGSRKIAYNRDFGTGG
jgi:hypothetical protein